MYYYTGLFIASMLSPSSLTLQAKKNTCLLSWFYGGCNAIAIAIGEQLILVLLSSIIEPTLDCDFAFVSDKKDSTKTYFLCDCDIEMQTHAAILSLPNTRRTVCR